MTIGRYLILQSVTLTVNGKEETSFEPIKDFSTAEEAESYISSLENSEDFVIQDQIPEDDMSDSFWSDETEMFDYRGSYEDDYDQFLDEDFYVQNGDGDAD